MENFQENSYFIVILKTFPFYQDFLIEKKLEAWKNNLRDAFDHWELKWPKRTEEVTQREGVKLFVGIEVLLSGLSKKRKGELCCLAPIHLKPFLSDERLA